MINLEKLKARQRRAEKNRDKEKVRRRNRARYAVKGKQDWARRRQREAGRIVEVRAKNAAKARRWRQNHPDAVCALADRRRAKKRNAAAGDPRAIRAFTKWARSAPSIRCYWCDTPTAPGERHTDHIIPLARGGSDSVGNLCVACIDCNQCKGARLPEEFTGQGELQLA